GKNSLNRLIRCVCGKKIGPDPRNFNQRVSLGRNDLLIRTFPRRQIEATKKSIQAGQRMNIDLLNAEQSFYKTKVELTAEKHAVIKAWVSLLAQTGEINNDNVMLLDSYFAQ
ncbi:TolC family protein, partial [Enterobacter cloacae]